MAPGPSMDDPKDRFRILESDDGLFFPQYKGFFFWKFYFKDGDFRVRFDNIEKAKDYLKLRKEEKQGCAFYKNGQRFRIHKVL